MSDPEALSIETVASVLGVCKQTAYRLVWSGKLPAFKVGRYLRVARIDLIAFRRRMRVRRRTPVV